MRQLTLVLFSVISLSAFAQKTYNDTIATRPNYNELSWPKLDNLIHKNGYVTKQGFTFKIGDTLHFAKGTLLDRRFNFAYESKAQFFIDINEHEKIYMGSQYGERNYKIKNFYIDGSKRRGFTIYAVFGIGTLTNYWCEIDNAIDAAELILPEPFSSKVKGKELANKTTIVVVEKEKLSVADELKKLKGLLDSGVITEDEFEKQKKKLLEQ